jgi:pimeloyl-ACP methyl ester carboxylesterase
MRRPLAGVLALALILPLAACRGPRPQDLAATTPWDLARREGHWVNVDGLRVFAVTVGTGRDVVLVHGDGASSYTWRHVIEPLAQRYRVHAIDLPGYGFSDKPAGAPYDVEWFARQLIGYLDQAGVQKAVLVGNSMGGQVVAETAILAPDRVAGLVLLDAAAPDPEPSDAPLSTRMLAWPVVGPLLRQLPARDRVAERLREIVYDPDRITDVDVDVYYAALRSRGGTRAYLRGLEPRIPPGWADQVAKITAPTLVVSGDSDHVVPPATARRWALLIPDSVLIELGHTGHLPQEEQPQRVTAEIVLWADHHAKF